MVIAAACGILTSLDKTKLQGFGGNVDLTRDWAHSFLTRMNYVQRKGTTGKYSEENFAEKKKKIRATVEMEETPTRTNSGLGPDRY